MTKDLIATGKFECYELSYLLVRTFSIKFYVTQFDYIYHITRTNAILATGVGDKLCVMVILGKIFW